MIDIQIEFYYTEYVNGHRQYKEGLLLLVNMIVKDRERNIYRFVIETAKGHKYIEMKGRLNAYTEPEEYSFCIEREDYIIIKEIMKDDN